MDQWVSRLLEATDRSPRGLRIDWGSIEGEMGLVLPDDYKNLCESFGVGEFSGYVTVLSAATVTYPTIAEWWKDSVSDAASGLDPFPAYLDPYSLFRGDGSGLIYWGGSEEAQFYWLAGDDWPANTWRIVARESTVDPWHEFDFGVAEFIYLVLCDASFPLSVASLARPSFVEFELLDS
ncbi:hypothetical protein ACFVDI_21130 [Nocardioides sp. NPDC057767]|uniref:hypothetical protein n=1 Tax=unclassified Nocardioides TaxID=2615069 RepID=UPI00366E6F6D